MERQVSKLREDGVVVEEPPERAGISREGGGRDKAEVGSTSYYWTPHPRTGIYVPKGHEWVVDDVPKNAASFDQTYWLRNNDGVDKADHDLPYDHYFQQNTSL